MPEFPHQHIKIPANALSLDYAGSGRGSFKPREISNPRAHADYLSTQIKKVNETFQEVNAERRDNRVHSPFGLILSVESEPDYALKFDSLTKAPSKTKEGVYLLNVKEEKYGEQIVQKARILVPQGQLGTLSKKISDFGTKKNPSGGKPSNNDLVANINKISVAALDALWMEDEELPEERLETWWELWISRADTPNGNAVWEEKFDQASQKTGIQVNSHRLSLPENVIVMAKGTRAQLESSLDLLNTLTEVHKIYPCSVGLRGIPLTNQAEYTEDLLERTTLPGDGATRVCLIDTGVNRGHPLIENVLSEEDLYTVLPQHGTSDDGDEPHGTVMSGVVAYGSNLQEFLMNSESVNIPCRLESVKLLHTGRDEEPENYGALTKQAILDPMILSPSASRVYCMALTSDEECSGAPTSWSSGVDLSITQEQQLLIISAGNHRNFLDFNYPKSLHESRIQAPAQAWNALTVGANTHRLSVSDPQVTTVTKHQGLLAPYSRTSVNWDAQWPIKPEIVMEGGNLAQEGEEIYHKDELALLTTNHAFNENQYATLNATSAATALASRITGQLMNTQPGLRPETYRGLLPHSARWTPEMLAFGNPQTQPKKRVEHTLRCYGYGEPCTPRVLGSGESGTTMIIEDEIHAYDPESSPSSVKLGNFNLHETPLPTALLAREDVRDLNVRMTVTLSYFIIPSPSSRATFKSPSHRNRSLRYQYSSHLLRFDVKNRDENEDAFQQRLQRNVKNEEEETEVSDESSSATADSLWTIGSKLRNKGGSLLQDYWEGSAAQLSEMGQIAVYPAKGWLATRSFREGHEYFDVYKRPLQYSLLVSIDCEEEIGLYTAINNIITPQVSA